MITAWGEQKTVAEWARDERCSISAQAIHGRLARGITAEKAIAEPPKANSTTLEAWGEHKSPKEWAQDPRCSINASAIRGRRALGWTAERAISEPTQARSAKLVEAWDENKTAAQWSQDPRANASEGTIRARITFLGWTAEQAISKPAHQAKLVEAWGESKTIWEWSQDPRANADEGTIWSRLERGINAEIAIEAHPYGVPRSNAACPKMPIKDYMTRDDVADLWDSGDVEGLKRNKRRET